MEKKVSVLLIVMLIIGFAGGFILSYVVYQPQIQTLTNQVVSLEEDVDDLEDENDELLADLIDALSKLNPSNNNTNNNSDGTTPNGTEDHELLTVEADSVTTDGTHFVVKFTIRNSGEVNSAVIAMYLNEITIQNLLDVTELVFNGTSVGADDPFSFPIPIGGHAQFIMTIKEGVTTGLNLQSGDNLVIVAKSSQLYDYPITIPMP